MRGLEFALNDIGLVAFTTLAPAATCAYMALALLSLCGNLDRSERARLENWLILPLAIATVGLIASATHLGDPGNALYVFMATGQSPLSNEVLTAIIFLGTSCSYWLARIYFKNMRILRVLWLLAGIVTGCLFIAGTANAYQFSSVITWNTTYALINLPLTGLAGCAPLVALVLICARLVGHKRFFAGIGLLSLVSTAAACLSMFQQFDHLGTLHNAYGSAAKLAPWYPKAIVVFAICAVVALIIAGRGLVRSSQSLAHSSESPCDTALPARASKRTIAWCTGSVLLVYLGIAGVRFAFYCFHMTAGVV